ncbi:hypothetical protein KBD59_05200 [Candidatus Gracilibacteria bacterium]|nr:hypothetical protein [Candidatus Gracilibacteria bacterium]
MRTKTKFIFGLSVLALLIIGGAYVALPNTGKGSLLDLVGNIPSVNNAVRTYHHFEFYLPSLVYPHQDGHSVSTLNYFAKSNSAAHVNFKMEVEDRFNTVVKEVCFIRAVRGLCSWDGTNSANRPVTIPNKYRFKITFFDSARNPTVAYSPYFVLPRDWSENEDSSVYQESPLALAASSNDIKHYFVFFVGNREFPRYFVEHLPLTQLRSAFLVENTNRVSIAGRIPAQLDQWEMASGFSLIWDGTRGQAYQGNAQAAPDGKYRYKTSLNYVGGGQPNETIYSSYFVITRQNRNRLNLNLIDI